MLQPDRIIWFLSLATLVSDIFIVLASVMVLIGSLLKKPCFITRMAHHHGLSLLFIIALTASAGSLFFSEIAQFIPCKECWFQRIFMYVQVPLLLVAIVRKDRGIAPYILTLCVIGALVSVKQYYGQVQSILIPALTGTCGDPTTDCTATQIFKFGYITIPVMAFTAFVMNALIAGVMMRRK